MTKQQLSNLRDQAFALYQKALEIPTDETKNLHYAEAIGSACDHLRDAYRYLNDAKDCFE